MRCIALIPLVLAVVGCGSVQRSTPQPPAVLTIPTGSGEWVIVEREVALESITTGRLVLPYGAGSTGRGLKLDSELYDPKQVLRYQIVFTADPLAVGDRCALTMKSFQVVHADGSVTEAPVHGHVVDNSDHKDGFRADLSQGTPRRLVIPAGATATAMFDQTVSVPTH